MKKSLSLVFSLALFICCCFCIINTPVIGNAAVESLYGATATPYGGMIQGYVDDDVYYARKVDSEKYVNPFELPVYLASGIPNACAITAGGAIIAHFDRVYEELIPNHTGIIFMGHYVYGTHDDAVDEMHQQLYTRMESTSEGTTVEGYKKGMISYVKSKGRSIEITNIYDNSSLKKSSYMEALQAGKLLTVFLDGFSIVSKTGVNPHEGYDTVENTIVNGLHIVAAYGYRNIKYYDASNKLIQEDNYLYVHTGFSTGTLSMIRLSKYTTIDDGYIINIT